MKEAYWGYWFILMGVFIMVVMIFAQDATTTTTQDYYQLKEVANAAIYDSIDYAYYSQTKQVRMLKEIFVENFIRRFSENASMTDTYQIDFFDLYESPPKVSVKVKSYTGNYNIAKEMMQTDLVNTIDIIVEFNNSSITEFSEDVGCEYYA